MSILELRAHEVHQIAVLQADGTPSSAKNEGLYFEEDDSGGGDFLDYDDRHVQGGIGYSADYLDYDDHRHVEKQGGPVYSGEDYLGGELNSEVAASYQSNIINEPDRETSSRLRGGLGDDDMYLGSNGELPDGDDETMSGNEGELASPEQLENEVDDVRIAKDKLAPLENFFQLGQQQRFHYRPADRYRKRCLAGFLFALVLINDSFCSIRLRIHFDNNDCSF